jgi:LPS-assembly protein
VNRLFAKRGNQVGEMLTWDLAQRRYFDPDFGGAVMPGRRNVFASTADLTPYAFMDVARNQSPVVSVLRFSPKPGFGLEWRADYDPVRGGVVDSSFDLSSRFGQLFVTAGHSQVRNDPVLSPSANQFRGTVGFGNQNRRGWNAAAHFVYDYRVGRLLYSITQVTYNTDCCGFSVQVRRFSFGSRNETMPVLAFTVANIGSFGSLKKQDRLF